MDQALGQADEQVARPADLVYFGDGIGPVSHGSDGLNAADLVDGIHPGDLRRHQYGRVKRLGTAARRCKDNLFDSGDPGGDSGHQDGGRIGGGPSGSVEADPVQGPNQFAQPLGLVQPIRRHDGFMELFYPLGGQFQRTAELIGDSGAGLVHLGGADQEVLQVDVIQHLGVMAHGCVATRPDIPQDADDRLLGRDTFAEDAAGLGQNRFGQAAKVQGVEAGEDLLRALHTFNQLKLHLYTPHILAGVGNRLCQDLCLVGF